MILMRFFKSLNKYEKVNRALATAIPAPLAAMYVLSLAYMNFFALKEFNLTSIAVIDCAFLLSWVPFMITDLVIKWLDYRAAVSFSVFGAACNVVFSILLWFVTKIPTSAGLLGSERYVEIALSEILGSHMILIFGSAASLIVSTIVKCKCIMRLDAKADDPYSIENFYKEVAISSIVGQLVDNALFAFFSAFLLFHWRLPTIVVSILIKTGFEIFMEMLCLPLAYTTMTEWRQENFGEEYFKCEEELKSNGK